MAFPSTKLYRKILWRWLPEQEEVEWSGDDESA